MTPPSAPVSVGWLARALVAAEFNLRSVEEQVQGFLTSLFPDGWKGWSSHRGSRGAVAIDVYEAIESPAAVAALIRAGFTEIRIHPHESSRFVSCMCSTKEAP